MSRYIDADALLKNFQEKLCFNVECSICPFQDDENNSCMVEDWIKEEPTADVREVVCGEWKEKEVFLNKDGYDIDEWQSAKCSVCGKHHTTPYKYYFDNYNYCPCCGADMKGETDEQVH